MIYSLDEVLERCSQSDSDRALLAGFFLTEADLRRGLEDALGRGDHAIAHIYAAELHSRESVRPEKEHPSRPHQGWLHRLINRPRREHTEGDMK